MKKTNFPPGTIVQSTFRSRWTGIVISTYLIQSISGKDNYWGAYVLILYDKNGHPMRRREIRRLSTGWLVKSSKPMPNINPEWLDGKNLQGWHRKYVHEIQDTISKENILEVKFTGVVDKEKLKQELDKMMISLGVSAPIMKIVE